MFRFPIVKPIFIFSLPRAGSTLLQRLLNKSEKISTVPETWMFLHFLSFNKDLPTYSTYSSFHTKNAIDDFVQINVGKENFQDNLIEFFERTFIDAVGNNDYFLEKTPRNLIIHDEITSLYKDDAKYIYLLRNPISIALSMMNTWGGGHWNIYTFKQDFHYSINNLVAAVESSYQNKLVVSYENLVKNEAEEIKKISSYLDIDSNSLLSGELEVLQGRMGDPTGQIKYKKVDSSRADNWQNQIDTYAKQLFLRKLLKSIGEVNMESLGYNYSATRETIKKSGRFNIAAEIKDVLRYIYGCIYLRVQPFILRDIFLGKVKTALR
nr:sulfotransferase [Ferrimonas balearica]